MAGRPSTARSEISSAISDDGLESRPQSAVNQNPTLPNPPPAQHGFAHLRGITQPTSRTVQSPPPGPASPTDSSRPHSPTTTTSRTHVPSLTAQGFHRPLSSSRLQAQRLKKPAVSKPASIPASIPDDSEAGDTQSVASSRQGPHQPMPPNHRPRRSLGTDFTQSESPEPDEHASHDYNSNHEGETGLVNRSKGEPKHRPTHLNITKPQRSSDGPQKSPLSFRSLASLGSKRRLEPGHRQLGSTMTSPQSATPKAQTVPAQSALGKNHEYFEGNTVFWGGGRFQNARDRPVNIATGIVLVLPAILFFVYS